MVTLLETVQPDFDHVKDCAPPPPTVKRFSMPAPLPDEGKVDPGIEQVIGTIHDQLDTSRMTRQQAFDMHCDLRRQRADARDRGGISRSIRSMHRRVDVLLEAYHPGATTARCR